MKIGVFDSGIGGITVLNVLRAAIPGAHYIYLGDTANLPYGTKSPPQVARLSLACATFLKDRGVDAVIVACNTASSLALGEIRKALAPIPVYGVLEPGVQAAVEELGGDTLPILVLATRATVKSRGYGTALRQALGPDRPMIYEQACPLLVPLIEEGWIDHPVLHLALAEYVGSYRSQHPSGVALLGCTHYPWIQQAIEAALPGWKIIDSANAVARVLKKELAGRLEQGRSGAQAPNTVVDWVFTDPEALPAFARKFIGSGNAITGGSHE